MWAILEPTPSILHASNINFTLFLFKPFSFWCYTHLLVVRNVFSVTFVNCFAFLFHVFFLQYKRCVKNVEFVCYFNIVYFVKLSFKNTREEITKLIIKLSAGKIIKFRYQTRAILNYNSCGGWNEPNFDRVPLSNVTMYHDDCRRELWWHTPVMFKQMITAAVAAKSSEGADPWQIIFVQWTKHEA